MGRVAQQGQAGARTSWLVTRLLLPSEIRHGSQHLSVTSRVSRRPYTRKMIGMRHDDAPDGGWIGSCTWRYAKHWRARLYRARGCHISETGLRSQVLPVQRMPGFVACSSKQTAHTQPSIIRLGRQTEQTQSQTPAVYVWLRLCSSRMFSGSRRNCTTNQTVLCC